MTLKKLGTSITAPLAVAGLLTLFRITATNFEMLSTAGFMPHKMCLSGSPALIWANAITDQVIAICYFVIPTMLIRVFRHGIIIQPKDTAKIGHVTILLPWFSFFILFCGMTHEMDVITLWFPFYYIDIALRILTAFVSVGTCVVLARQLPILMGIISQVDLVSQVELLTLQVARLARAAGNIQDPAKDHDLVIHP